MLVAPHEIENRYDLCIVGAGPSGIILSLEFARLAPNKRILIVEFGGAHSSRNSLDESIVNKNPLNHFDPYDCTNKGLGGTTATWGGRCVMYDPVDFIPHGPINDTDCTWDLSFFESCKPFVQIASGYFHCGSGAFDLSESEDAVAPIAESFVEGAVTSTKLERWSLPTRFGPEYRNQLASSTSIHVLQGFEGRDFVFDSQGGVTGLRIRSVKLRESGGNVVERAAIQEDHLTIEANNFVLANGGQEATRVLLRNVRLFGEEGRTPSALGRYYQGHLSGKIANVRFKGNANKTGYGYLKLGGEALCRRRFQFSPEFIDQHELLNTAFWLDNLPVYDARHRNGVLSLIYLIMILPGVRNRLLHAAIIRTLTNDQVAGIGSHLLNVLRGFPFSFLKTAQICAQRYLPRRKLPGLHLKNKDNLYALHFHAEQVPRYENYMQLESDGESLVINYGYSDEEIDDCIRAHQLLDEQLQRMNCGRLEYYYDNPQKMRDALRQGSKDGLHQIGTTRIGKSSREGVVDKNLRVFGAENVYVCASSVFPTSGQANPTFFLGVCAARLANHLAELKGSPQ